MEPNQEKTIKELQDKVNKIERYIQYLSKMLRTDFYLRPYE